MSDKYKNNKLYEIDKFWNIDFMLPKKNLSQSNTCSSYTEAVDIIVDPPQAIENIKKAEISVPKQLSKDILPEPLCSYEPDNQLIKNVNVWLWPSHYSFYEQFKSDAHKYHTRTYDECDYVKFFSYMPQYSELKYTQMCWYLWWRHNVRNKIYLHTDDGYIYLYIYEIVNLQDVILPIEGIELLCDIWLEYRKDFPKMDSYLCEWICDYCLINQIPMPYHRLEPIIGDIIYKSTFKEFYVQYDKEISLPYVKAIVSLCSNYNWQKSKFLVGETKKIFEKHLYDAFIYAFNKIYKHDKSFFQHQEIALTKISRDAYSGSLCAYNMKRHIDIEYYSCTRSQKLRFIITDMIKLAENCLRNICGVKSRLSISSPNSEIKECIQEYFENNFVVPQIKKARNKTTKTNNEINKYEHLYEVKSNSISLESAMDIEKSSWETTNLLVETFAELEDKNINLSENILDKKIDEVNINKNEFMQFIECLDDNILEALRCIITNNTEKLLNISSDTNMLTETIVEKINNIAYDTFGDIAIEENNNVYTLISDYEQEIKTWMKM